MAKIKQGILGGFSGSVANVVGSSWKGIAVMKSKPLSVANPRTPAQVAQRLKFKSASQMADKVKANIIKPLWDKNAQYMTGVNAWMSENVKHFYGTGLPIVESLVFSKGNIASQPIDNCNFADGGNSIDASWNSTFTPTNALPTDLVAGVAVDGDGQIVAQAGFSIDNRDSGSLNLAVVDGYSGTEDVYCFVFFKSIDGIRQSNQAYKLVSPEI